MSIAENIKTRKAVEACYELVGEYLQECELSPDALGQAWRRLGDMMDAAAGDKREPSTDVVMSDDDAKRFGRRIVPFGRYSQDWGDPRRIQDVPLSYLVWLEEADDFRRDLTRYLKRREIWDQQDE